MTGVARLFRLVSLSASEAVLIQLFLFVFKIVQQRLISKISQKVVVRYMLYKNTAFVKQGGY